jgi:hypothetical protein
VVFKSPKRIELLAELTIRIECPVLECRCGMLTEGIVIGCESCVDGGFEITVLFLQEDDFGTGESAARIGEPAAGHLLD